MRMTAAVASTMRTSNCIYIIVFKLFILFKTTKWERTTTKAAPIAKSAIEAGIAIESTPTDVASEVSSWIYFLILKNNIFYYFED